MASVKLENLTKRFKDVVAVNSLNLEIRDKEFLVLVGPSGCGKTTALRMVAGLEEVTEGSIYIGDRCVNDLFPKDRDIAMVFQNYALYPHMTVYDNLAFGLRMRGLPDDEGGVPGGCFGWIFAPLAKLGYRRRLEANIREEVNRVSEMLGLRQLLHRKPKQLSGGQRQRVALGRAIVRRPHVFLMDEPLSNLDAKLRVQTRAELIKLHRDLGITTIYVTHDQVEAMTMGQRIAVMNEGVMQQCDTPLTLYRHPVNRFVAGFIGSPAMNFIDGAIEFQGSSAWFVSNGMRLAFNGEKSAYLKDYDGKAVVFGVRPEDIHDHTISLVPAKEGNTTTLAVDVIEPMGDRSIIYARSGEVTIVASISSETIAKELADLPVVIDMDKTHIFEVDSGAAVFPNPSADANVQATGGGSSPPAEPATE